MLYSDLISTHKIQFRIDFAESVFRLKPGEQCDRLTVVKYIGHSVEKRYNRGRRKDTIEHWYICKCSCGNPAKLAFNERALKRYFKEDNYKISCGCANKEHIRMLAKTYLQKYRYDSQSSVGRHLGHIRDRCYNPNNPAYPNYGGRGIGVCDEWNNLVDGLNNFGDWMYKEAGYTDEMKGKVSINRVNNDKDYSPDNCHLSYSREQGNNMSRNTYIDWYGQQYTSSELPRRYGVNVSYFKNATKDREVPIDEALFRKERFRNPKERNDYLSKFPTKQFPVKPFIKVPFQFMDFSDIDPRDPRRYYPHPNQFQTLYVIALQARLKAAKEGHPVKPFEFTDNDSDDFLGNTDVNIKRN